MGNKKRTYTIIVILLAVVALGIGYAAVSNMLNIDGTATVLQSDGAQVQFTGTPTNSNNRTGNAAAIDGTDPKLATCTVVLKDMGETATCTFTISNTSTDQTLSATNLALSVYSDSARTTAWTSSSSQYFTITSSLSSATIAAGGTATATITVTLKKENTTGSDITENFYAKIVGDTTQS